MPWELTEISLSTNIMQNVKKKRKIKDKKKTNEQNSAKIKMNTALQY